MTPAVVFDTNILFSAIGWNGRPAACLERARLGIADGATSQALLDELAEKLRDKLAFSEEQSAEALADLLGYLRVVETVKRLAVIAADPDDDRVLECAVAAGATYIVTGDRRHLLPLGSFRGIRIVSAADFLTAPLSQQGLELCVGIGVLAPVTVRLQRALFALGCAEQV